MSKIKFLYSLQKDAYNYARLVIYPSRFSIFQNKKNLIKIMPKSLQDEIINQYLLHQTSHSKLINISGHPVFVPVIRYLRKSKKMGIINSQKEELESAWKKYEKKYFITLKKILKRQIFKANYKCYLTTLFSCPVNFEKRWFMVAINKEMENKIYVICHEFMHLQFIYWYRDYCLKKGLNIKQFQDLKEAITFILNEKEFDFIKFKDPGYDAHQELRKILKKVWRENQNFKVFLDKAIEITKKLMPLKP